MKRLALVALTLLLTACGQPGAAPASSPASTPAATPAIVFAAASLNTVFPSIA